MTMFVHAKHALCHQVTPMSPCFFEQVMHLGVAEDPGVKVMFRRDLCSVVLSHFKELVCLFFKIHSR